MVHYHAITWVDRASATGKVDSGSIFGQVKLKTIKKRYLRLSCLTFSNKKDIANITPPGVPSHLNRVW